MDRIEYMSMGELQDEIEWMEMVFEDCKREGHGISTKETVRYNELVRELAWLKKCFQGVEKPKEV